MVIFNKIRRLSSNLHEVKASGLQLSFNIFWLIYFDSPQLGKQKKKKLYITLDYWSRDSLIFNFSGKGLGIVSPHFVYNFSRKKFFHVNLYYLTKSLYLITLTSWDIRQYVHCNCYFSGCDVVNSETNLTFLIKPIFYMTKNLNILRTKRDFKVK